MNGKSIKIGACQVPEILENPLKALDVILQFLTEAESKNIDLLLFPECFLSGYILSKSYVEKFSFDLSSKEFRTIMQRLEHIKTTLVFGISEKKSGEYFNSAIVITQGNIVGVYRKGWNEGYVALMNFYKNKGQGIVIMLNSNAGEPLLYELQKAITQTYQW